MEERNMRPSQRRGSVLITGASSGIGEDAALYLNELGYTVFAGVRRTEAGEGGGPGAARLGPAGARRRPPPPRRRAPGDGERVRRKAARPDAFHHVLLDVTDDAQVAGAHD